MPPSSSPVDRAETPVGGGVLVGQHGHRNGNGVGGGGGGVGGAGGTSGAGGGGSGGGGFSWNHPNFSSPGRLDQPTETVDSTLQYPYGTRMQKMPSTTIPLAQAAAVAAATATGMSGAPITAPAGGIVNGHLHSKEVG